MELIEVKQFMRIDEDNIEDDNIIIALYNSAIAYIEMQTGKQYIDGLGVWNIAILLLTLHWYDNRSITGDKTVQLPHSVSALINHIALCGDYD